MTSPSETSRLVRRKVDLCDNRDLLLNLIDKVESQSRAMRDLRTTMAVQGTELKALTDIKESVVTMGFRALLGLIVILGIGVAWVQAKLG